MNNIIEQLSQLKMGEIAIRTKEYRDLLLTMRYYKRKAIVLENQDMKDLDGFIQGIDTKIKVNLK